MGTYISMLNWTGYPQPRPYQIRAAIRSHDVELKQRGLHSVALLPDEGTCAAVMVATVGDEREAAALAAAILPDASIQIDSVRFDEEQSTPAGREVAPQRASGELADSDDWTAVLQAVVE